MRHAPEPTRIAAGRNFDGRRGTVLGRGRRRRPPVQPFEVVDQNDRRGRKTIPGVTDVAEAIAGAMLDVVGRVLGWLPFIPPDGDQVSIVTDPTDVATLPFLVVPLAVSRRGSDRPGSP